MCTLHYTERNKSTGGGVGGGGQHQSFVETVNASERSKPVVGRFGVCVCLSPSWAEAPNQRKIIIIPTFLFDVSSSPGWTLYVIRSQYNSNFGQLLPEIIIQDQVLSPAPQPSLFHLTTTMTMSGGCDDKRAPLWNYNLQQQSGPTEGGKGREG